jgi:hypothetical protein
MTVGMSAGDVWRSLRTLEWLPLVTGFSPVHVDQNIAPFPSLDGVD